MEIINDIKNNLDFFFDSINIDNIIKIKKIIENYQQNNIYITGIGKCETLAIHFSNLLKSISYQSFYISPQNSTHGDIGSIKDNDLLIVFSKSGNTLELINFLKIEKIKHLNSISISCSQSNKINNLTKHNIVLPLKNEIQIGIKNIPNNSCTLMLITINILIKMLENIDLKEYKLNHSGGSIGNDLLTIEQVMLKDFPQIKLDINKTVKIIDIVIEMTNKKTGLVIINDEENNIKGIISDGDIRRLLINNQNLNNIFLHNINQKYYYESNKNIQFKNIKENLLKYKFIPIVENKKCIGLLHENLIKKDIYL